jgi:hypothetical protein
MPPSWPASAPASFGPDAGEPEEEEHDSAHVAPMATQTWSRLRRPTASTVAAHGRIRALHRDPLPGQRRAGHHLPIELPAVGGRRRPLAPEPRLASRRTRHPEPLKLDVAYLYNLAAARTGDIFGERNTSLIATVNLDYEAMLHKK